MASAEARSAAAGSTTSRGRPVEPEVATSTPSPGSDVRSVGRAAAVTGGGTRAYGGAVASRGTTAGPPSSAWATAAARAATASGEPSSRMVRTGPSSVARRRHRTSCEPVHTQCARRACCSGCAGRARCASTQRVCVRRAASDRLMLTPRRRSPPGTAAARGGRGRQRPPRPHGPGRRRGEHERGRRPARLRSGGPGRSGRGRGRSHPLNPAAHRAGAPGRPRSPVRVLSSARGTARSR